MSEPISEAILVHAAEYYPCTGNDSFGNPTHGTKVDLSKIRIGRAKTVMLTALGEAKKDKLILNYDCTYSLPSGVVFKHNDKIVYSGASYLVREASDPSGDTASPHHYRVALVGG